MKQIDTIRAALEQAGDYIRSDLASERGAFEGYEGVSRIDEIKADLANNKSAIAALDALELAAAEPVAWMWEDMLGISHTFVSPKRPTWPDAGASPEMAVAINVRPLYAAPPAPVAEIRKVVVTDEMALRISEKYHGIQFESDFSVRLGRDMISAVRAELGPTLSLVELKEPTPEECADMAEWFKSECAACCINPQESADYGRAIFDAVKIVLWPKEGL